MAGRGEGGYERTVYYTDPVNPFTVRLRGTETRLELAAQVECSSRGSDGIDMSVRVTLGGQRPSADAVAALGASCRQGELYTRLGKSLECTEEGFSARIGSKGVPLAVERVGITLAFYGSDGASGMARLANYAVGCLFYDKVCRLCSGVERLLGGDTAEEDELVGVLSRYLARDDAEEAAMRSNLRAIRRDTKPFCVFFRP